MPSSPSLPALQPADVRLVKTFVAVAEAGGLSAAQVKLHRSLTSISSDLQDLETRLGNPLCRRGRSGFALTDFGRQVYEASHQLFAALDQFQLEIMPSRNVLRGELRIAVNEGQINDPGFVLSEAVRRFRDRPKNLVRIGMAISSHEQTLQDVVNDAVDVGFGFFQTTPHQIERIPLHGERNLLYCGREHPLFGTADRDIAVEQVVGQPMVQRAQHAASYYPAAVAGVSAASIGRTPESRAYMIMSGHYLGWLGDHHAERWVQAGMMRPVLPEVFSFHVTMEVAVKRMAMRPAHIALFLADLLTAHSERWPAGATAAPASAERAARVEDSPQPARRKPARVSSKRR